MLIAADPAEFFTEPHYDGYPAVLVRLDAIDEDELTELLTDAWRAAAPRRLLAELDAGSSVRAADPDAQWRARSAGHLRSGRGSCGARSEGRLRAHCRRDAAHGRAVLVGQLHGHALRRRELPPARLLGTALRARRGPVRARGVVAGALAAHRPARSRRDRSCWPWSASSRTRSRSSTPSSMREPPTSACSWRARRSLPRCSPAGSGTSASAARHVVGIAVAATGALLVLYGGGGVGGAPLIGWLLGLVTAATWAAYSVLLRPLMARYSAERLSAAVLLMGSAMLVPVSLPQLSAQDWSAPRATPGSRSATASSSRCSSRTCSGSTPSIVSAPRARRCSSTSSRSASP